MAGIVSVDHRKAQLSIARFLHEDGSVPTPPEPAWCLIVNGKVETTYRLGEERSLIEHYFKAGKDGG